MNREGAKTAKRVKNKEARKKGNHGLKNLDSLVSGFLIVSLGALGVLAVK
jgi:hypothetical protein